MNNKIDVLNLEWTSNQSRDREVVSLVTNYLRLQGLTVFEGAIFDGYSLIDKLKPRLLYITNSVGAQLNIDIINYAKSKGIFCITGMAEGNFNEDGIEQFVWGVNKSKVMLEDECYLWNVKSHGLTLKHFPYLKNRMGVCGAVGFDRYKIAREDGGDWLNIGDKKYDLVVGVGCWNYDFTIEGSYCYKLFNGLEIDDKTLARFRSDRDEFNQELVSLIESNPNVLFLVKVHPGCLEGDYSSAIEGIRGFDNVIIGKNEFSVMQAIAVSDVWLTYESTTAVEAWLMGTPTALLNPSGTDFPFREGFHLGQPNFPNAAKWREVLKTLAETGTLEGFADYSENREEIISDMIQWGDGLNHVRMGNVIYDFLKSPRVKSPEAQFGFVDFLRRLKRKVIWSGRKLLNILPASLAGGYVKYAHWDYSLVDALSEKRLEQQKQFYQESGFSLEALRDIKALPPSDC